jgi:DNA-binding MarR family transcriptional regulator
MDKYIADLWAVMTRLIKRSSFLGGHLVDEHDLTQPQILTLWQLKENGPMTMGKLSELLAVTHGVATRMVDRLLKKGMVERRRDAEDRRVVLISLTGLGETVIEEAVEDGMTMVRGAFEKIPLHDREEFLALLSRIEEAQVSGSRQVSKNGGLVS